MIALLMTLAHAQQVEFDAGIAALREGDHASASEHFVAALDAGGVDPAVYHALGNALYRRDHSGAAIAAWSRGMVLSPSDGDLLANLERARGQTVDRLEPPQPSLGPFFWQAWIAQRTSAALASLALTLALILLGIGRYRPAALTAAIGGVLIASTLLAGHSAAGAVVIGESVSVRSALGPDGVELFVLHEGAHVAVAEQTSEHTLVVLPDGRKGWAPTATLISTDPEDTFPLDAL